jgi:hypothetical protein
MEQKLVSALRKYVDSADTSGHVLSDSGGDTVEQRLVTHEFIKTSRCKVLTLDST